METIYVTSAEYLGEYKLLVHFNDGEIKVVDLGNYLDKPVFQILKDKSYFEDFQLNPFTVEWKNGADFAPEFLYQIGENTGARRVSS